MAKPLYEVTPYMQMMRNMREGGQKQYEKWDYDALTRKSTEAQQDVEEGASKGGLLGGLAGFGTGELLKYLAIQAIMGAATGGTSFLATNPLVTKGLMWGAGNLLNPLFTALGANIGTEKGISDVGDIGESQYGTNWGAYQDVGRHFSGMKSGLALNNMLKGGMYGGMLNTGLDFGKSLLSKVGTEGAKEGIESQIIDEIVKEGVLDTGVADIFDVLGAVGEKSRLANVPEQVSSSLIKNIGKGTVEGTALDKPLSIFDKSLYSVGKDTFKDSYDNLLDRILKISKKSQQAPASFDPTQSFRESLRTSYRPDSLIRRPGMPPYGTDIQ